jgi:two-component system response regulator DevR
MSLLVVGAGVHNLHTLSRKLTVAPDIRSAIAMIRSQNFDCIVIDRDLEDGDGLVLAPTISRIQPDAISILLTTHTQWATREAARQLGFHQVINKSSSIDEIVSAIRILATPGNRTLTRKEENTSKIYLLSLIEREILLNLATGATTEEIAAKRHNSVATIKSHLSSIYRKLEVRNRVEAVAELRRN